RCGAGHRDRYDWTARHCQSAPEKLTMPSKSFRFELDDAKAEIETVKNELCEMQTRLEPSASNQDQQSEPVPEPSIRPHPVAPEMPPTARKSDSDKTRINALDSTFRHGNLALATEHSVVRAKDIEAIAQRSAMTKPDSIPRQLPDGITIAHPGSMAD